MRDTDIEQKPADLQQLSLDLQEIKRDLKEMKEMLTLFRNAKGFLAIMKFIGLAVGGIAAVGAAIAGTLEAFKYWVNH